MDRISKALDRAKQTTGVAAKWPQAEQQKPIAYTRTRTVPVTQEILRKARIVSPFVGEPLADAYRLLRTRILHRMKQRGWRVLGITSPGPGEGKTLTAINLAISMAMELNHTVVLVDADLRHPNIHNFFGIKPEVGLSDYLTAGTPVEEILISPGIERFVILPGRKALSNSSELLASAGMVQLVQDLKRRYQSRMVIFDLPPALVGDDVVAFSPQLDTALLVIEDGKSHADEVKRAADLLHGIELVGTVLNKSTEPLVGYDYSY